MTTNPETERTTRNLARLKVLDGRALAALVLEDLATRVEVLAELGYRPGLGTVLVGSDPGSRSYVAGKHRDCTRVGISSFRLELPGDASEADVLHAVQALNDDDGCTGFIVQLPLPQGIDRGRVLSAVLPGKDADGLHPYNLGQLTASTPGPLPCTPRGIVELLRHYDVDLYGAHVVVVGAGLTVGRPLTMMLTRESENATVTLCHRATVDLEEHLRRADVIIAAAGTAGLIRAHHVRPGATVVDVGITRTDEGLLGDVDPDVAKVAGKLSRTPGGVGPMTRAMLMTNVVEAAERRLGLAKG
ncbi:bifunctional methylenetetrahydrofolate dehydrogenase/methenyltetrahydrofolate cyclohydrolase [Nocardioides sp. YJ-D4]